MIERIVSIYAVAQALFTTLQAGTNLLERYVLWENDVLMDGPRILPPNCTNNETTSPLYDLTECVRDGIRLGLQPYYDEVGMETSCVYETETVLVVAPTDEDPSAQSYSLSLQPILLETNSINNEDFLDDVGCNDEASSDDDDVAQNRGTNPAFIVLKALRRVFLPWLLPKDPLNDGDDNIGEDVTFDYDQAYVMNRTIHNTTTASVRAYAPQAFHALRRSFGISALNFERVLLSSGPYVSFQTNSKGSAAKGVFFFTPNGAFLVKSIKKAEKASLLSILPQYTEYMREQGGHSLLSQICGMYEVVIPPTSDDPGQDYCLIIMNSVFPPGVKMSECFDLKGSTVGRQAGAGENVKKDLDLVYGTPSTLELGHNGMAKHDLLLQLRKDVKLLEACSLIDYSLLVGISLASTTPDGSKPRFLRALLAALRIISPRSSTTVVVPSGRNRQSPLTKLQGRRGYQPATYFLGVIDFLQPFNARKAVEYQLKCLLHKKNTFSCVPPSVYARRFNEFLEEQLY